MARSRPLSVETLEDRFAPATWNNPWPDAQHLTLSFPRDGTVAGGQTNVLHQTLNKIAPTATWQKEILRAFQTWAAHADINIGLVADQGQPLGSSGRLQGDERFGDIRIVGYSMSDEVLAIGSPFAATAGTWAGDVKFNTAALFGLGAAGRPDLFTVALQEAGHSLGLAPSNDPTSVMFGQYRGPRTAPSAADIAALRALYGPRSADAREGSAGNNTFSAANSLTLIKLGDGSYTIGSDGDITSTKDVDFTRFTAPKSGTLNVTVKTGGLSLLTPRVTVYDSVQRAIASATDTNPLTGDLVVSANVSSGKAYYVKVESGRSDAFGVGRYQMETRLAPAQGLLGGLLGGVLGLVGGLLEVLVNDDHHTNDSLQTASLLPDSPTPSRFDHAFQGSISDKKDLDFYQVKAPVVAAGKPNVMTVMVWGLKANGLLPAIKIYDATQKLVPAEVLVNENGTAVLQLANAVSGASYFVEVAAANPAGPNNVGNYFLGIDFGKVAEPLATFAQSSLTAANPKASSVLTVKQTQLFHFVLKGEGPATASVRMTILNRQGAVVGTLTAAAGKTVSLSVHLAAGAYLVRYENLATSGAPLATASFQLKGVALSDPIGPRTEDATEDPAADPSSTTAYDESTSRSEPESESPPPEETWKPAYYSEEPEADVSSTSADEPACVSEPAPEDPPQFTWSEVEEDKFFWSDYSSYSYVGR